MKLLTYEELERKLEDYLAAHCAMCDENCPFPGERGVDVHIEGRASTGSGQSSPVTLHLEGHLCEDCAHHDVEGINVSASHILDES